MKNFLLNHLYILSLFMGCAYAGDSFTFDCPSGTYMNTENNCVNIKCEDGKVLDENSTCITPKVNITFNLNSQNVTWASGNTMELALDENILLPNLMDPTQTQVKFLGWSTLKSTSSKDVWLKPGSTFLVPNTKDKPIIKIDLYAVWGAAYKVLYDLNGGGGVVSDLNVYLPGAKARVLSPSGATPPKDSWSSDGKKFFGWGSDPDGKGLWYSAGEAVVFSDDVTLYALWYYPITYNCGSLPSGVTGGVKGSLSIEPYSKRTGEALDENPKLTGNCLAENYYTLSGWSSSGKFPVTTHMPNTSLKLKGIWEPSTIDKNSNGLIDIYTLDDLYQIRYNLNGTSLKISQNDLGNTSGCPKGICTGYELMNHIDFQGSKWASNCNLGANCDARGWEPIGTMTFPFASTFDGKGFEVKNLYINHKQDNLGLFGYTSAKSIIKDVGVVSAWLSGASFIGGLIGVSNSDLSNVYVKGIMLGVNHIGGLVGMHNSGSIKNSFAIADVMGCCGGTVTILGNYVGGLVGAQETGSITASYAWGTARGLGVFSGGLMGFQGSGSLSQSYAANYVPDERKWGYTGGIIGRQAGGSVTNVYWDTQTSQLNTGIPSSDGSSSNVIGVTTAQMKAVNGTYPNLLSTDHFLFTDGFYPRLCKHGAPMPCSIENLLPNQF